MSDNNTSTNPTDLHSLTSAIVVALIHQGPSPSVGASNVAQVISDVFNALTNAGTIEAKVELEPAVSVRASVKPDYIVCLEDGKKLKMLKRYLMTQFNMTPDEYRAKWNLPADYPMVAPNYAESRREIAKSIGLGQKKDGEAADHADVEDEAEPAESTVHEADAQGYYGEASEAPADPAGTDKVVSA